MHIVSFKTNLITLLALFALTILTVITAQELDLGSWNLPLALAIATFKVVIVLMWFMHLKYDDWINRIIVLLAVIFLSLLYVMSLGDILTRHLDWT